VRHFAHSNVIWFTCFPNLICCILPRCAVSFGRYQDEGKVGIVKRRK
jgi:hypothetical protein